MAAATMYVTPTGAGIKDGAAWSTAFGEGEFEADLETNAEAGDIYYVLAGTYTLDSAYDASLRDGTGIAPISIIGVKAGTNHDDSVPLYSDWGSGVDRPTFACDANTFLVGDFYKLFNLIITISTAPGMNTGGYSIVFNCKSTNNSGSGNRYAITTGGYSAVINCEAISTLGVGITSNNIIFSYVHDSATGIYSIGNQTNCLFNVIDTCTTNGINIGNWDDNVILNNTVYNCPTGVLIGASSYSSIFVNSIIDTATDGFKGTTQINDSNFFSHNHVGNSVTDMWDTVNETDVAHKDNNVTGGAGTDPHFTNEAGGDLSLETDSPCLDTGMALTLGVG